MIENGTSLYVLHRLWSIIIIVGRMQVKDSIVIPGEGIECQIKTINGVIAVIKTSPTPVEVEHIEIVIAIKHIGMATCIPL